VYIDDGTEVCTWFWAILGKEGVKLPCCLMREQNLGGSGAASYGILWYAGNVAHGSRYAENENKMQVSTPNWGLCCCARGATNMPA